MITAIYTPTRNPGIAVSYYSVKKQNPKVDHWFVGDQLASQREENYRFMRQDSPWLNIESYQSEILPGRVGNLAHVDNWALNRARSLNVDLLVYLQDFIWMPDSGVASFLKAAKTHPFDLITGRVVSSEGPACWDEKDLWNIFLREEDAQNAPPGPWEADTRDAMGLKPGYLSNHAWEVNYGALPYALINAGVDFDEDYDYGSQWGNTQFSFDIWRRCMSRVWWDHANVAISMPHREYFPKTHAGERDVDNGWRFWKKNSDLVNVA